MQEINTATVQLAFAAVKKTAQNTRGCRDQGALSGGNFISPRVGRNMRHVLTILRHM